METKERLPEEQLKHEDYFSFLPEPDPAGFRGETPDLAKLDRFVEIRRHCSEIRRLCPIVIYRATLPSCKVSYLYCILKFPAGTVLLNESIRAHLAELFRISSRVNMDASDSAMTFRFQVDHVWTEEHREA